MSSAAVSTVIFVYFRFNANFFVTWVFSSDRHQLVQQIQMIGSGALGQPAATAVRHVAAQNGVWSLGNFGGVPPKSAMMYHQPGTSAPAESGDAAVSAQQQPGQEGAVLPSKIETNDYRYVFNSCAVGMVSPLDVSLLRGAFQRKSSLTRFICVCRLLRRWVALSSTATDFFASCRTTQSRKFVQ